MKISKKEENYQLRVKLRVREKFGIFRKAMKIALIQLTQNFSPIFHPKIESRSSFLLCVAYECGENCLKFIDRDKSKFFYFLAFSMSNTKKVI
jgi:hypothetical protein